MRLNFKSMMSLTLAAALSLGLAACGKKENKPTKEVQLSAMKGPTAMGLVKLTDELADKEKKDIHYEIKTMPDEVVTGLMKGELDLACVPANLAATLYNKSEGKIQVAAINTLNALYFATNGIELSSLDDLKGKTIYATGKGATPDATLNTILAKAGLKPDQDVTIEFKSEASEVAGILASQEGAVAFLPQPFLTTVTMKNDKVKAAFSADELWKKYVGEDQGIVTGVLVVRKDFLKDNEAWFKSFLAEYKKSAEWVKKNPVEAGELVGEQQIVPAAVAAEALPKIGIGFIEGKAMKDLLAPYLGILAGYNPKLVGGQVPADDFYYNAD